VSIRKISNKKLSRNLKTRKAPLRVLPLVSFHTRHRLKKNGQKHKMQEPKSKQFSASTFQCTVEKMTRTTAKGVKKSTGKKPLTIKPFLSFHGTMSALRWILLLIFIYLAAGTIVVMIQDGTESFKNIVVYSIIGFFTFFMGYLGWILARDFLGIVSGKRHASNEAEVET